MGQPAAPTPPDPRETAAAQTGTNVATSVANTAMGNVNRYGPQGSLEYSQSGTHEYTDPYTGETHILPTWSATTSLGETGQQLFDQNQQTQLALGGIAQDQAGFLGDYLSDRGDQTPPTLERLQAGNVPTSTSQGPSDPITKSYGTDFSADRQRVEDALMGRIQPKLDREREAMEVRLANQGITPGSEAYRREVEAYGQRANDATYGAITGAGQEQNRLAALTAQRARFENAAQSQGFAQDSALNAANNAAMQQDYFNMRGVTQANNQIAGQQYGYDTQGRNQPINEISALLSGSQVQMPNYAINQPSGMPTVDQAGLINQNYQQRYGNYQQEMERQNQIIAGLFGLGAGGLSGGYF